VFKKEVFKRSPLRRFSLRRPYQFAPFSSLSQGRFNPSLPPPQAHNFFSFPRHSPRGRGFPLFFPYKSTRRPQGYSHPAQKLLPPRASVFLAANESLFFAEAVRTPAPLPPGRSNFLRALAKWLGFFSPLFPTRDGPRSAPANAPLRPSKRTLKKRLQMKESTRTPHQREHPLRPGRKRETHPPFWGGWGPPLLPRAFPLNDPLPPSIGTLFLKGESMTHPAANPP